MTQNQKNPTLSIDAYLCEKKVKGKGPV